MPKNRAIPFGYCMRNGEITAEPKEVYAVSTIFSEYLKGSSLLQIAKLMESEKIRYTADSEKWNKNMVKRIIENERYLGADKYPQIIDENIFKQTNEKRVRKAAALNLICDDLKEIRKITYCAECGQRLSRIGGNSKYEKWDCKNPCCFKFEYRLTDQMINGAVLTALNSAIANPSLIECESEISAYSPTSDILRQQNEVNRMTDSPQVDFDRVKAEIFRLAEMKYDCCTYSDKPQKTAKLISLLKNHNQLNTLDIGLFKSCINKILISRFCTIEVEFINVSIKSEIAVKGLYSNIIPCIKQDNDDNLYPTAGEGRKKLLTYSIYGILSEENAEKKINLFLIEEPENHLHKSMQIALSQILFTDAKYTYLFVTTHSPFVLYEMDNVNLVRIYSDRKINGISTFYKVPENYEKARKMLNRCLSEAIFANKVLLVEGPSEYMLFSKVLAIVHPFYEADGIYILSVDGVGFETYFSILDKLEIFNVVKTDNDLRAIKGKATYSVLGFSRCNKYIGKELLPTEQIQENSIAAKRALYNANIKTIDKIRSEYSIFLSKVDLENDLDEVMHDRLLTLLGETLPVDYLQDSKHYHMVELIEKLSDTDCRTIYNHYNFACLKEVAE